MTQGDDPNLQSVPGASIEQSLPRHLETRDLYEEGFSQILQAAATDFKKFREMKVANFKGGYSSDASLMFQSWLKISG